MNVPDLYHCLSCCFRKLVSAILRSLYSHLSKNVRDLYAAREIVEDNSELGCNLIYKTTLLGVKKASQFKTTLNVQSIFHTNLASLIRAYTVQLPRVDSYPSAEMGPNLGWN